MKSATQKQLDQMMKNLLKYYDPYIPIHTQRPECVPLLREICGSPKKMDTLDILSAKGFLDYETSMSHDEIISITIRPLGRTYFEDKVKARRQSIITTALAIVSAVASVVAAVASVISLFH